MSKKISTIGYRNGLFVGQVEEVQEDTFLPRGIGLVMDDMFLTCFSSWHTQSKESTTRPRGPTLLLYPHKQILYLQQYPFNSRLKGIWCFVVGNIKIFGNGQDSNLAVLHTAGQVISKIKIKDNKQIEDNQQNDYHNEQQKWHIIEKILACKIPESKRNIYGFIQDNFQRKLPQQQRQDNFYKMPKKDEDYFGLFSSSQGLIFSIKSKQNKIQVGSIGYYHNIQNDKYMQFGRQYKDQGRRSEQGKYIHLNIIQQGNYDNGQIYQYQSDQKRPVQSIKTSRNYFRQATSFSNKFVQFQQATQVYGKLIKVVKQYSTKISSKYGQRIIQGNPNNRRQYQQQQQIKKKINKQQLYLQGEDIINRQYNLQEARMNIQKMVNRKRNDHNTNTNKKTGSFAEIASHYNYDDKNSNKKYREAMDRSRNKDITHLDRSIYNEIQPTSRMAKSPLRSSPKKYIYSQIQNQPLQVQRKQRYYPQYPIHNDHYRDQYRKIYTVNEFTLHTNPIVNRQNQYAFDEKVKLQRQRIIKEYQAKKQRVHLQRHVQRQKPVVQSNRQILRQNQVNVQYDPIFSHRFVHKPMSQYHHTYSQPNRQLMPQTRKIHNMYNYMQDKLTVKQNPSPFKINGGPSKIERVGLSPISKINNYQTRDKSPVSIKPSGKKIYSYMD